MHQTGAIWERCTALTHGDYPAVRAEGLGDGALRIVEQATIYETCQRSVDAPLQCAASLCALIIAAGGALLTKPGFLNVFPAERSVVTATTPRGWMIETWCARALPLPCADPRSRPSAGEDVWTTFLRIPRRLELAFGAMNVPLRREQECYGFINDGAGKRYLLGPLYLLMGDTAGALRSFAWFAQTFPDDGGDPLQYLCWTLALYRAGALERAAAKLRQTMLSNLYLLPRLLGLPQDHIDMWYPSNLTEKVYSDGIPHEVLALWEPTALHWAHIVYQRAPMQRVQRRYIAIYHQLQTEPPGLKRSRLMNEAFRLHYPR